MFGTKHANLKRKVRDFSFEVKEIADTGEFSGYASVYDVVDVYREVVARGAFEKSLKKWQGKGRLPPSLWQHRAAEPLGPHTLMREDEKGLYVEGKLLVDEVARAREARALMKAKAVGGMSIGYNVIVDEYNKETQLLTLKEVDLWEVSIVTFPANEAAVIQDVKTQFGDKLPTVRQFEEFLRESGFSKAHATAIASQGLGRLLRDADSRNGDGIDAKSILDQVFQKNIITAEEIFK
jgi:HK97 family phage prohead protease